MFARLLFAGMAAALVGTACSSHTTNAASNDAITSTHQGHQEPQPSTNPDASKDAEFFKDTPEQFVPFVAACDPWDDWEKPAPPFRIYGSTYYVGTCGISAILIDAPDGLVLIDSGTEGGANLVLANIRELGFDPQEIVAVLYSHEHFDHIGGMAQIQEATGAPVYAAPDAVSVLETGADNPLDPQAGMHDPMRRVENVIHLQTGTDITYAGKTFHPIATPGHTYGALSWTWEECEESSGCLTVGYADSLSPISRDGYRFSDHPDLLARHEAGVEALGQSLCSLLLTPHPSSSRMLRRMRRGGLIEAASCAYYAIDRFRAMEARLEREASGDQ